ncbi:MAG: hypothetical protein KTV45_14945 [Acidimicrobiia bacterium]|nr:hypothetical protein [Acidimicrobiia bacterium]
MGTDRPADPGHPGGLSRLCDLPALCVLQLQRWAGDLSRQADLFDEVYRHTVQTFASEYLWYPYRYDLAWNEYPDTITVVATYPLGEQRLLIVDADIATRKKAVVEDLPLPPPIFPTTPFIDPWYPESADALGRKCPPVEQRWAGRDVEVTDPCTLAAIEQAVDWMWRGDALWRQRAIRDGYAMDQFLHEIDAFEDPHMNALLGLDSRTNGSVDIHNVVWAGNFPAASMIYLKWRFFYPQREFTPEEYEARVRYRDHQVEVSMLSTTT